MTTTRSTMPGGTVRGPLVVSAAAAALGAGACAWVMLPAYAGGSVAATLWWAIAGLGLVASGAAMLRAPSRRVLAAGASWSGIVLVAGLTARGLGFGEVLWQPVDTAVGFTDLVHAVLQAMAALLGGLAAVRRRGARTRRRAIVTAIPPLLLIGAVTTAGLAFATDGFTRVTAGTGRDLRPGEVLAPGTTTTLTYCAPQGAKLGMDVYEPRGLRRPAPVVLYVHGGGLIIGDRRPSGLGAKLANHDGALFRELRRDLAGRGMVVASIDYRLAPLAPWPAPLQDATCAVRYLRAHAAALGIDPARIGVWGSSSGGQLAALLGTAPGVGTGPYPEQSSRVQAVVDMFGPTDLNAMRHAGAFARAVVQIGLGGSRRVRAAASPLTYAAPGDPPFLILQGTEDLLPPAQSVRLTRRLSAAHVPVTLIWVRGAGHGLNTRGQRPSADALARTVTAFFLRSLAAGR